jgi:hypothetical protein
LFARGFIWKRQPYENQESIVTVQHALRSALAELLIWAGSKRAGTTKRGAVTDSLKQIKRSGIGTIGIGAHSGAGWLS